MRVEGPATEQLTEISKFFRVLSEPARLQLLCSLKSAPSDVQTLVDQTGFSQSHISRQLTQLAQFDLVKSERERGRLVFYADSPLVDQLCELVSKEMLSKLEAKMNSLKA